MRRCWHTTPDGGTRVDLTQLVKSPSVRALQKTLHRLGERTPGTKHCCPHGIRDDVCIRCTYRQYGAEAALSSLEHIGRPPAIMSTEMMRRMVGAQEWGRDE